MLIWYFLLCVSDNSNKESSATAVSTGVTDVSESQRFTFSSIIGSSSTAEKKNWSTIPVCLWALHIHMTKLSERLIQKRVMKTSMLPAKFRCQRSNSHPEYKEQNVSF